MMMGIAGGETALVSVAFTNTTASGTDTRLDKHCLVIHGDSQSARDDIREKPEAEREGSPLGLQTVRTGGASDRVRRIRRRSDRDRQACHVPAAGSFAAVSPASASAARSR
ncbi:hypothetical protein Ssi02_57080 [Sinosporangium siamense]|uniref:Uncharacterized protein n=1 Tax=Sinosporangium siamense TaxID=1367973 RepID=A0A919VAJ3_9ACTN|nr:hypothetical protein Ssi02_57080 [Sinosporangium siamense]